MGTMSHIFKLVILPLLLFAPLYASSTGEPPSSTPNFVRNSDLRDGTAYWWGPPRIILTKASGKVGIEVTSGFVAQDKISASGARRYKLSVSILSDDAPQDSIFVQMSARGPGVDPGWIGSQAVSTEGRTEPAVILTGGKHSWKTFTSTIETPKGTDQLLIYLRKVPGTPGKALFADIELRPTNEAPTSAEDSQASRFLSQNMPMPDEIDPKAIEQQLIASKAGGDPHPIIGQGIPVVAVHVGRKESLITLAAAAELNSYLGRVAGHTPPNLSSDEKASNAPLILVGGENLIAQKLVPAADIASLSDDGFIVRSLGRTIIIAGRTPRGTMYGVNWFIDRQLGVRWLSPEFTYIPSVKQLTLPRFNMRQEPRFSFREILVSEAQDKVWRQHNLLNGESHGPSYSATPPTIASWDRSWQIPGSAASFLTLLPQAQFAGSHPDWYAGGQLAMMNSEMRAAMAQAVIANLRKFPDYRQVWYSISDEDWGWDMDPQSRAFAAAHGGHASAPRLDMMIDVANQVRKALPGARFAFNAYHWSFIPPTGMTVPNYILVYPMTIQVDYSRPLFDARNGEIADGIAKWNSIASHIIVWDHITNFGGFIQPTPNIIPIAKSIKWLSTLRNVQGYFAEGSWDTRGSEFNALRSWIMSRLLWDPSLDIDKLIADFCSLYYGPAAPFIERYVSLYHRKIAESGDRLSEKTPIDLKMFDTAFMIEAESLFDQAEAAAKGTRFAEHVGEARIPLDYVLLVRRHDYQTAAKELGIGDSKAVQLRSSAFLAKVEKAGITQFYQGGSIASLKERIAIERKKASPPNLSGQGQPVVQWREIQDLSFNLYGNARLVADAAASDGAAVSLSMNDAAWNIQLKPDKLPKTGNWWIYAAIRTEGMTGSDEAHLGSAPPMNCFTKIMAASEGSGTYSLFEVPAGAHRYSTDHNASVYLAAVPTTSKGRLLVDRFIITDRPLRSANNLKKASSSACTK